MAESTTIFVVLEGSSAVIHDGLKTLEIENVRAKSVKILLGELNAFFGRKMKSTTNENGTRRIFAPKTKSLPEVSVDLPPWDPNVLAENNKKVVAQQKLMQTKN